MSLSTTPDRISQSGNGSTTAFNFPYLTFAQADLVVILKNNASGVETTQILGSQYTISGTLTGGIYLSGCTVNFLTAPIAGQTVIVYRDRSVTQELDLDENGKIPAESLEKQLDKIVTFIQRTKNKLARTIGLKEGYTASFDPSLPNIMVNDGYIKTKSDGSGVEYISQDDLINTINTSSSDFTANRALQSSSSGLAEVSNTTSTELGYVSGVTSAIQTQINGKEPSFSILPISKGGTNSNTALTNSKVIVSTGGALVESATTTTQLSYLDATSSIQTQMNSKIGIFGVVTRTSTYTATTADGTILCSGGAFTINLYTAVGNVGREITIIKTDSSLTNIITVDANSTETIDGALTFKLTTLNDRVLLISNGSNWIVKSHTYSTAPISVGTMTIGATTTSPTIGTTTTNDLSWYREGQNAVIIYGLFHQELR
jgi:hypothetical protein